MTMNEEQGMFNRNDEMRTGNVEFIWGSVRVRDCLTTKVIVQNDLGSESKYPSIN